VETMVEILTLWWKIKKNLLKSGKSKMEMSLRYRSREFIEIIEYGKIEEFDIDLYFKMI